MVDEVTGQHITNWPPIFKPAEKWPLLLALCIAVSLATIQDGRSGTYPNDEINNNFWSVTTYCFRDINPMARRCLSYFLLCKLVIKNSSDVLEVIFSPGATGIFVHSRCQRDPSQSAGCNRGHLLFRRFHVV